MYLCEGMWLFPFCAEDRFFNQPRAFMRGLSLAERNTPIAQNFVLYSVYFALAGGYHAGYGRWVRKRTPICPLTLALEVKERVAGADCCIG